MSIRVSTLWPGLALAGLMALPATFVAEHYGGPQLLYALFFGLAFHFLFLDARCAPGIEFATRTLLRIGVALLGARITLSQIGTIGIAPLAVASFGVLSTVVVGAWLARRLGRARDFGLLTGGAVAICGASAAMAISLVMPRNDDAGRRTLLTVVGVTGLSTMAMIVYPLLVKLLGLSDVAAGIFFGGTIHDVAQVIGAAC